MKIDLVITYLNSNDEQWQKDFNYYKELELKNKQQSSTNRQAFGTERTREWNNFKYVLRGIEKNLPWFNKIFLVVQNERHVPSWLNKNNPKLRIVYHDEFMPKELLPSFNANAILFYLSNIKDLSENYIYLDDDCFFINPMTSGEFFDENGVVCDVRKVPYKINDNVNTWEKVLNNNKRFYHRFMTEENECIFRNSHLPEPKSKSFELKLMKEYEEEFLNAFNKSKFRKDTNFTNWLFFDMMKLNKPENKIERIEKGKYIHYNSKINMFDYKDYQMICVNDTEAMDDFFKCKENLNSFLRYKLPDKCSFELEDTDNISPCFGIISWLPDKEPNRSQRVERLNKTFEQIKEIFGDVEYLIVAQNWKDYELPEYVKAKVFKYDKLGILGARKTLGKHFLESNYDYLIMCDDDVVLKTDDTFTKEYFFEELKEHPEGFMFLQYSWSLNLCAISKYIYAQSPMIDIDPEKGEGYEDTTYPWYLHYKHPDNEFKINGIKFIQNNREFHINHKSTWEDTKQASHNTLHNLSEYHINQFKRGNFILDKNKAQKYLKQLKWYEDAIWYGWCSREEYDNFKKNYQ